MQLELAVGANAFDGGGTPVASIGSTLYNEKRLQDEWKLMVERWKSLGRAASSYRRPWMLLCMGCCELGDNMVDVLTCISGIQL
jgi:hypothetical protein